MSVKVIDKEMFLPPIKDVKLSMLTNDIDEIVSKRIEYSELELPYSPKTCAKDIQSRARRVLLNKYCKFTGTYLRDSSEMPLDIVKRKDSENNYHLLCHFKLDKWDKMIERANK